MCASAIYFSSLYYYSPLLNFVVKSYQCYSKNQRFIYAVTCLICGTLILDLLENEKFDFDLAFSPHINEDQM